MVTLVNGFVCNGSSSTYDLFVANETVVKYSQYFPEGKKIYKKSAEIINWYLYLCNRYSIYKCSQSLWDLVENNRHVYIRDFDKEMFGDISFQLQHCFHNICQKTRQYKCTNNLWLLADRLHHSKYKINIKNWKMFLNILFPMSNNKITVE